jgi:hypothetical protein
MNPTPNQIAQNRGGRTVEALRVTRVVHVQNLVSIPANTTSPTTGFPVYWPSTGTVLWIVASVAAASSADQYYGGISSLGLRINILGMSEFITSGQAADYVQFSSLMPSSGFRFPINVNVVQNDTWTIYVRNLNGANAYTPDVAFGLSEVNS